MESTGLFPSLVEEIISSPHFDGLIPSFVTDPEKNRRSYKLNRGDSES